MENPFPVAGDSDNNNLTSYIVAGGAALGGALAMWLYKKLTAPDTDRIVQEQLNQMVPTVVAQMEKIVGDRIEAKYKPLAFANPVAPTNPAPTQNVTPVTAVPVTVV